MEPLCRTCNWQAEWRSRNHCATNHGSEAVARSCCFGLVIGAKAESRVIIARRHSVQHDPWALGQAYCIVLFITGASVFGLLISHFNETWEAESRANREMEDVMEPYLAVRPK